MKLKMWISGRRAVLALGLAAAVTAVLISSLFVRVAAVSAEGVPVPILMYHSVGYNDRVQSKYFLSPEAFEEDMCWLFDHGYTSVFVSDLVSFVRNKTALPEKPVVITLDDGFLNNLTYVLPILEKYDMRAVISVVGSFCQEYTLHPDPDPAYAYLTWEDVSTLHRSGRFEIANHTYEMHTVGVRRGCMRRADESVAAYSATLSADLSRLQSMLTEKCGVTPTVFAYPYGAVSSEALYVLQSLGFQAALTCDERINYLSSKKPEQLYRLGRFNRPAGVTTKDFMTGIFS